MLHILPLHHIHGLINCLLCPLSVGAQIVMLPKFNPSEVWDYFLRADESKPKVNLFSAVPTCFVKLIQTYEEIKEAYSFTSNQIKEKCKKNIRLMTCGSSPLPNSVFYTWEKLTGHTLLERYGMSEIGMALSNPLKGARIAGSVGNPLPSVKARIVRVLNSEKEEYQILAEGESGLTKAVPGFEGESGELQVKGPSVFKEYWGKPEATIKEFTKDGWFKTGDIAVYENGVYKILGRASADIVKSGGYKISTLDIERFLLEHPQVLDCAAFGIPDDIWGEAIMAVVAVNGDQISDNLSAELKDFCKTKLPPYSIPKVFKCVDNIPRNVMGKVNKKELKFSVIEEMKKSTFAQN